MGIDINSIEKELDKKEKILDEMLIQKRSVVRFCANSIKSIHSKDLKSARAYLKKAQTQIKILKKYTGLQNHLNHILQEYVEAVVLYEIFMDRDIPSHKKLIVPVSAYLNGLLDCVGELKREMYESLRKGDKKSAQKFFEKMEFIFDSIMHLKYSNSILPEFRRKQDVARIQIEQARGELI